VSEYRSLIDRVADPVNPPPDAFERLVRRRTHRHRNRRIGTAVLSVAVAAAGISGAFVAFGHPTKPLGGVTIPGSVEVAPLWPQYSADQARRAQERADAGDPNFTWLLDSSTVAESFAKQYLGWGIATSTEIATGSSAQVIIDVCRSVDPCPDNRLRTAPWLASVTLRRLNRSGDGGTWSVTGVRDPAVGIWGPDGHPLREHESLGSDDPVAVTAEAQGDAVGIGTLTDGPCGFLLRSRQAIGSGVTYVALTPDMGSCREGSGTKSAPGYVLAYLPGRAQLVDEGHHPEGIRLTALPVRFVSSAQGQTLPSPTEYWIDLPTAPMGTDATNSAILDATTNLPENTWVSLFIKGPHWATLPYAQVHGGLIEIRASNDRCHRKDGKLIGSRFIVTATVGPGGVRFFSCGFSARSQYCGFPQAPSAIQVLGRHFEFVQGPQVHGGILEASHSYQLSADTCT
jgi:hypothetical protein